VGGTGVSVKAKAGSVAIGCAEGKLHACKIRTRIDTIRTRLVFIVPPEIRVSEEKAIDIQLVNPS
jgi:hypothetical protein